MFLIRMLKRSIVDPLKIFIQDSRAIGIILLFSTFLSLCLANIDVTQEWYKQIWLYSFDGTNAHHFNWNIFSLPNSVLLVINDFFMTLFFFLAGMEIKREFVEGELTSLKQSALPVVAAIGGMIVPAILYTQFNKGTEYMHGWAVPMATDIAFTLGVATLLGKRIPISLKIFITALAIIDDLGAILVIALFYGAKIQLWYLVLSVLLLIISWLLLKFKVAFGWYNWVLGMLLWYCMFNSGIHATVSGVLFAFTIPTLLLKKIEAQFYPFVYFFIMPVFALANTAIQFPVNSLAMLNSTYSWGIVVGLLIGKPLGICMACYLMIKNKLSVLPAHTNWHKMIGAGILAGIGFTMSIFISTLAFRSTLNQDIAKIAVLITSFFAILIGFTWLKLEKLKLRRH
ncbi:MAG: Na+/H+ antiporter NhaA [Bacteroidota bacterium]|nr:Na+/H+ antiporter NhaA [Bacteroidota bacterium]